TVVSNYISLIPYLLKFYNLIIRKRGKYCLFCLCTGIFRLSRTELIDKSQYLYRDQRRHGDHFYHAESVRNDISSGAHTRSYGKREQEGGRHRTGRHAA